MHSLQEPLKGNESVLCDKALHQAVKIRARRVVHLQGLRERIKRRVGKDHLLVQGLFSRIVRLEILTHPLDI